MVTISSPYLEEKIPAERRSQVLAVLSAALEAADPRQAVLKCVHLEGDRLRIAEQTYSLADIADIYVVGAGKGAAPMAAACEEILGDRLTAGAVNVKYGYVTPTRRVRVTEAGHPLPDESSIEGTGRISDLAESAGENDLVLCVISGGASALLVQPPEGVTLAEMRQLTDALLKSGAPIEEINTVRKHLDEIKGGGLAALIWPARTVSLILSDVVGDPLDAIASGPTVPDPSTFEDTWAVLECYDLLDRIPPSIVDHIARGKAGRIPETPKPRDQMFDRVQNVLVGSNEMAARAAREKATRMALNSDLLSTSVVGEARNIGGTLADLARHIVREGQPVRRPACVILGGETTVTVRGSGKGGRNQEMALAAAMGIDGLDGVMIACLATDGTDGPTDAAGAWVDGSTVARARRLGLNPTAARADNDTYPFFKTLGNLLMTGPTNTNVNDLAFVFVW